MVWGGGASAITHTGPPVLADGSYSAGNLVYDSANALWLCTVTGTPGTWVQIGGAGALINPMTTAGDLIDGGAAGAPQRLAVGAAHGILVVSAGAPAWAAPPPPAKFQPADQAGTASATLVMMGLGAAVGGPSFTPAASGNVSIFVTGNLTGTAAATTTLGGRYGTGSAPANGAAVTGTRFGSSADLTAMAGGVAASRGAGFALADVLALTPATTYWFDLTTLAASGTVSIKGASFVIIEWPA